MHKHLAAIGLLFLLVCGSAPADDKKPDAKKGPEVLVAIPLGIQPGTTARITLRGLRLDGATEIRFPESKSTAKILSKGKADVPDKNPDKVGDTQVVAQVTVPTDVTTSTVSLVVKTPDGESQPHALLLATDAPLIGGKEPNNGFRQAQPISVPQAIDGIIQQPRDVDVFRLEGVAGQRLVCEVLAARYGSPLDSILTLYDAQGRELASNDDHGDSSDSFLEYTLPATGHYYLSLLDAHDAGGPAHGYRLLVRTRP
jgi:hypothetical protein